ncbi:MAG: hypothetical protein ACE5FL_08375 [Myxococcota bacterium]
MSHRRNARRAAIAACLAAQGLACAGPPPPSPLAFVARAPGVVEPLILRRRVEGTWCFSESLLTVSLRPPWQVRLADTGRAVTRAIESIPDANVLVDVVVRTRIEQYLLFQRVCSVVVGDAGRIE